MEFSELFLPIGDSGLSPSPPAVDGCSELLFGWVFRPSAASVVANAPVSFSETNPSRTVCRLFLCVHFGPAAAKTSTLVESVAARCAPVSDAVCVEPLEPFVSLPMAAAAAAAAAPAAPTTMAAAAASVSSFEVHLWHGIEAAAVTRAVAVAGAFRLERELRLRPDALLTRLLLLHACPPQQPPSRRHSLSGSNSLLSSCDDGDDSNGRWFLSQPPHRQQQQQQLLSSSPVNASAALAANGGEHHLDLPQSRTAAAVTAEGGEFNEYRVLQRGKRPHSTVVGADEDQQQRPQQQQQQHELGEMDGWSAEAQLRQLGPVASPVIADWLYLGGERPAASFDQLSSVGVTHVVNCAGLLCPPFHAERGLRYLTLRLLDGAGQDLISVLPWALDFIETARREGGRVYVHCQQGVSRSVSVVVAYEMWRLRCGFRAALERVKRRRPVASPHAAFIVQLIQWEKHLRNPPGPRLYYIGRLSEREPLEVAKAVTGGVVALGGGGSSNSSNNNTAAAAAVAAGLDGRTVYLALADDCTYVWTGPEAPAERTALAHRWVGMLHRFLGAAPEVRDVAAGAEPRAFWTAAGLPEGAAPPLPSARRLPHLDADLVLGLTAAASTASAAAEAATGGAALVDDNIMPAAPRLWWRARDGHAWERLAEFDHEDLTPDSIFLLDATRVEGSDSAVFVWLGEDFAEQEPQPSLSALVADFRRAQPDELPLHIVARLERQDEESDLFWNYFELS